MQENHNPGILLGALCYFLWGILPVYWKALSSVPPYEILVNRIIWSAVFMVVLFPVLGKWQFFLDELRAVRSDRRKTLTVIAAGIVITLNWGIFIWAVNSGFILETSMGYYINPLVNVLLGVCFLGERLDSWNRVAVGCAVLGVALMIFRLGVIPWVSLGLAASFGAYGLIKKTLQVDTKVGLLLETSSVLPFALCCVAFWASEGRAAFQVASAGTLLLLAGAGVVTAVPLLLFTAAAKLLPLSTLGFLQYLSPTITMLLGIFVYGEAFTADHLYSFGWIWLGLIIFTVNQIKKARR